MSFNKRYVTKEQLLDRIKEGRDSLDSYLSADALILDSVSSKFVDDLSNKNEKTRERLCKLYTISSGDEWRNDPDYLKLNSLADCLIYLYTDPSWIDISVALELMNIEIPESIRGQFTKIKEFVIDKIELKYGFK